MAKNVNYAEMSTEELGEHITTMMEIVKGTAESLRQNGSDEDLINAMKAEWYGRVIELQQLLTQKLSCR